MYLYERVMNAHPAPTPNRVDMWHMCVCVADNKIGDAGAASLAEAIKSCTQLNYLGLFGARVRVRG